MAETIKIKLVDGSTLDVDLDEWEPVAESAFQSSTEGYISQVARTKVVLRDETLLVLVEVETEVLCDPWSKETCFFGELISTSANRPACIQRIADAFKLRMVPPLRP